MAISKQLFTNTTINFENPIVVAVRHSDVQISPQGFSIGSQEYKRLKKFCHDRIESTWGVSNIISIPGISFWCFSDESDYLAFKLICDSPSAQVKIIPETLKFTVIKISNSDAA